MRNVRNQKGYKGIGPNDGVFVPMDEAFDHAAEAVGICVFDHNAEGAEEFREMLVEWFFSGNWIEVIGDG